MSTIRSFDNRLVIASFSYVDDLLKAIDFLKSKGIDFKVYTPCPVPEIQESVENGWSGVRVFTFLGAVFGLVAGFALAILTSLDWPLRTSAKEIVSIPGFVVVGYELTILLGGLATLFGLFVLAKVPVIFSPVGYREEFSSDRFGLVFKCLDEEVKFFLGRLRDCNAEDIEVRDSF